MRKKIVRTLKGDSLPPVTREYEDDTRNPFELFMSDLSDVQAITVFVKEGECWTEVLYLSLGE